MRLSHNAAVRVKRLVLINSKPVLSGHSKIDKTEVLKTGGSLLQVESIAECSQYF